MKRIVTLLTWIITSLALISAQELYQNKYELRPFSKEKIDGFALDDMEWVSDDDHVAVVTDNMICSQFVGQTVIHALIDGKKSDEFSFEVIVKPKHKDYPEPIMKWGMSEDELKKILGEPEKNTLGGLLYNVNSGDAKFHVYFFDMDGLSCSVVLLGSGAYPKHFLAERYKLEKEYDNGEKEKKYIGHKFYSRYKTFGKKKFLDCTVGWREASDGNMVVYHSPRNLHSAINAEQSVQVILDMMEYLMDRRKGHPFAEHSFEWEWE